ncbi:MDR family MFS transporter [Burkholderia contaminans]|uniref:MDR family MFS transporter n=2 Tax=Burkholderia contaminans TaxID=488447 RepID=UPI00310DB2A2
MSREPTHSALLWIVAAVFFMQSLDTTIVNTALPSIAQSLHASPLAMQPVVVVYTLTMAMLTPASGWLADRFGTRRVFSLAILVFVLASIGCAASHTLGQLVAARALQGIGGSMLLPIGRLAVLRRVPGEQYVAAIAFVSTAGQLGPIVGPTLGGWLTDSYNWRWVFFINVPIGAFALAGVMTFLPARAPRPLVKFDAFGFATLALAIGAFQAMLDRGEQLDWFGSYEIRIEANVAALGFAFFLVHTATVGKASFFKSELLRDPNFATGTLFIFVVGAVLYATRALLPPMLQNLMGYPVATTGLVTAPSGAGTMIAMLFVGRLLKYVDARMLLLAGLSISALALWQMMQYTVVLSEADIVWPGVVQGFGLGLVFVPLSALSFSTLPPDLRADGTATYSLMRNIGSSIGISIVQTLMTRNTQVAHADLATHITPFNPAVQAMTGSRLDIALLDRTINQQASMIAYLNDFKLMFVATLLMIPLLLLIRPPRKTASVEIAHAAMD